MNKNDQKFGEMMKNYRPVKAPTGFSTKVMDEIYRQEKVAPYQPVFGKWFIQVFVGAVGLLVLYASWGTSNGQGELSRYFRQLPQADLEVIENAGQSVKGALSQVPQVLLFALVGVTLLLAVDWFILRQRSKAAK